MQRRISVNVYNRAFYIIKFNHKPRSQGSSLSSGCCNSPGRGSVCVKCNHSTLQQRQPRGYSTSRRMTRSRSANRGRRFLLMSRTHRYKQAEHELQGGSAKKPRLFWKFAIRPVLNHPIEILSTEHTLAFSTIHDTTTV